MKLKVLSKYANQGAQYDAGQVIEVSEESAIFLTTDSPDSFRVVDEAPRNTEPEVKEFSAPADKMERKHRTK